MTDSNAKELKSLYCPTCYGPLSKDVLTEPIQCIYCDTWVATCDGRQQKMVVNRQQAIELRNGIQPSEPIFREGSPLDLLFGRIRRISPVLIGIPMVWVLMMHLYVGMEWVGPRALPLGDMDAFEMYTFIMCVVTAITGYSILSALVLISMSLSTCAMLLATLGRVEDMGSYMESESGIIAILYIGTPMILAVAWGMMQNSKSMQRHFAKIWAARFRFGLTMLLGIVVSFAYFHRPTKRQFIESKREEFTKQTDIFATLCNEGWSGQPTTDPIVPQPKLELRYRNSKGNVETVLCSRAISKNWVSNYVQKEQHKDLDMLTKLSYYLDDLHRQSIYYDDFLTPQYEESVNTALSAPYWLLYDPQCANAQMTAKLYDATTSTLLRRVKIPCSYDNLKDRDALLTSLEEETGGVFTLGY